MSKNSANLRCFVVWACAVKSWQPHRQEPGSALKFQLQQGRCLTGGGFARSDVREVGWVDRPSIVLEVLGKFHAMLGMCKGQKASIWTHWRTFSHGLYRKGLNGRRGFAKIGKNLGIKVCGCCLVIFLFVLHILLIRFMSSSLCCISEPMMKYQRKPK